MTSREIVESIENTNAAIKVANDEIQRLSARITHHRNEIDSLYKTKSRLEDELRKVLGLHEFKK